MKQREKNKEEKKTNDSRMWLKIYRKMKEIYDP